MGTMSGTLAFFDPPPVVVGYKDDAVVQSSGMECRGFGSGAMNPAVNSMYGTMALDFLCCPSLHIDLGRYRLCPVCQMRSQLRSMLTNVWPVCADSDSNPSWPSAHPGAAVSGWSTDEDLSPHNLDVACTGVLNLVDSPPCAELYDATPSPKSPDRSGA